MIGESDRLLATPTAVIAGITYNFLPLHGAPLYASLEQLDTRLIEAAKRPLRVAAQGVPADHAAALPAGRLRRHAA